MELSTGDDILCVYRRGLPSVILLGFFQQQQQQENLLAQQAQIEEMMRKQYEQATKVRLNPASSVPTYSSMHLLCLGMLGTVKVFKNEDSLSFDRELNNCIRNRLVHRRIMSHTFFSVPSSTTSSFHSRITDICHD